MQDQLQSLLNQIKVIIKEENDLKQRQYDSGETFNVFEVLRLQRNEVRLHSSFIAALLDPQGSHGLKTKPLKRNCPLERLPRMERKEAVWILY